MERRIICCMMALVAAALVGACSSTNSRPPDPQITALLSNRMPPQAEALWRQAEKARAAGQNGAAVATWERIVQEYPSYAVAAQSLQSLGAVYLSDGQPDKALRYLDYLIYAYPTWDGANRARLDRLRALENLGKRKQVMKEALPVWDSMRGQSELQIPLSLLMAGIYKADGDFETALDWIVAGFSSARSPEDVKTLTQASIDLLANTDEGALKRISKRNLTETARGIVEFRLASLEMAKGQQELARDRLQAFLAMDPSHPLASEMNSMLKGAPPSRSGAPPATASANARSVERSFPLDASKVGCLLPLNGPYARYGETVMRGLAAASTEWNEKHPNQKVNLVVKDSQTEPEAAAAAFEELVRKDGVLAVIGPLGSSAAKGVIPVAGSYGVPLLSLTQRDDDEGYNPYVVHIFLDNREMVKTLLRYTKERLGFSRFASLYPDDRYGQKLSKVFAEAVQESGGTLLANVSYKEKTTDFKDPLQKLITIARKNSPPSGVETTPFEALFVPDQVQTVSLLAPQLPYNNVIGATLLGTNLWGEAPLVQSGGVYVENAIFATPYFAESTSPLVLQFKESYQRAYKAEPAYLEAQAYDALMLLLESRSSLNSPTIDRESLMQRLLRTRDFQGVAGTYSFNAQGELERQYLLLQVVNGQLVQVNK